MLKWRRVFGNHWLGIWFLALALFAVQEIPYMIMPLIPLDANPIMEMQSRFLALDVFEKIFGVLTIVVMLLIVNGETKWFSLNGALERVGFGSAIVAIASNFVGWGVYFGGYQSAAIIITLLVVMPPVYYVAIGLWRKNYVLAVVGGLFLIFHFANVSTSLL